MAKNSSKLVLCIIQDNLWNIQDKLRKLAWAGSELALTFHVDLIMFLVGLGWLSVGLGMFWVGLEIFKLAGESFELA